MVLLARIGSFDLAPIVIPLLVGALIASGLSLWRADRADVAAIALLALLGILLYTPPAQHIALSGDAPIYPNEGAYIARTGGVSGVYEPLASLPPAARDPFFVSSDEQFRGFITVQSYDGLVYGGYYIVDDEPMRIHTARMPLAEVWYALLIKLLGLAPSFTSTALWR
ncbi:MAG: hypothetical protein HC802_04670 [Caldilineaceae bacterium]|nr:hypothetical protein [Caldilineaceae bacterium]